MSRREELSDYWTTIQGELFSWLGEELGPLTEKHKQLITVLEMARVEAFVQTWQILRQFAIQFFCFWMAVPVAWTIRRTPRFYPKFQDATQ